MHSAGLETSPPCTEQMTWASKEPPWPSSYSLHVRGLAALLAALPTKGNVFPSASFGLGTCGLHLLTKMVTTINVAEWSLLPARD